jgi:hypothetical protein
MNIQNNDGDEGNQLTNSPPFRDFGALSHFFPSALASSRHIGPLRGAAALLRPAQDWPAGVYSRSGIDSVEMTILGSFNSLLLKASAIRTARHRPKLARYAERRRSAVDAARVQRSVRQYTDRNDIARPPATRSCAAFSTRSDSSVAFAGMLATRHAPRDETEKNHAAKLVCGNECMIPFPF